MHKIFRILKIHINFQIVLYQVMWARFILYSMLVSFKCWIFFNVLLDFVSVFMSWETSSQDNPQKGFFNKCFFLDLIRSYVTASFKVDLFTDYYLLAMGNLERTSLKNSIFTFPKHNQHKNLHNKYINITICFYSVYNDDARIDTHKAFLRIEYVFLPKLLQTKVTTAA